MAKRTARTISKSSRRVSKISFRARVLTKKLLNEDIRKSLSVPACTASIMRSCRALRDTTSVHGALMPVSLRG
jgi:hypothetical protein